MRFAVLLGVLAVASAQGPPIPAFVEPMPLGLHPDFYVHFDRMCNAFGVRHYAHPLTSSEALLWNCAFTKGYLDNDVDGTVDNPAVVLAMVTQNATMVHFPIENGPEQRAWFSSAGTRTVTDQDNAEDETQIGGSLVPCDLSHPKHCGFDATIEEVWHLITYAGYQIAYPLQWGRQVGTPFYNSMQQAIATNVYDPAANGDSPTGNSVEYHYWVMSTILGFQDYANRQAYTAPEWKAVTAADVATLAPQSYMMFTDPQFAMPTRPPTGRYPN